MLVAIIANGHSALARAGHLVSFGQAAGRQRAINRRISLSILNERPDQ